MIDGYVLLYSRRCSGSTGNARGVLRNRGRAQLWMGIYEAPATRARNLPRGPGRCAMELTEPRGAKVARAGLRGCYGLEYYWIGDGWEVRRLAEAATVSARGDTVSISLARCRNRRTARRSTAPGPVPSPVASIREAGIWSRPCSWCRCEVQSTGTGRPATRRESH